MSDQRNLSELYQVRADVRFNDKKFERIDYLRWEDLMPFTSRYFHNNCYGYRHNDGKYGKDKEGNEMIKVSFYAGTTTMTSILYYLSLEKDNWKLNLINTFPYSQARVKYYIQFTKEEDNS